MIVAVSDSFLTLWTVTHRTPLDMGFSQARILAWVAIPFSRGSSWCRNRTWVCCIGRWILYCWATNTITKNQNLVYFSWLIKIWVKVSESPGVSFMFSFKPKNSNHKIRLDHYHLPFLLNLTSFFSYVNFFFAVKHLQSNNPAPCLW